MSLHSYKTVSLSVCSAIIFMTGAFVPAEAQYRPLHYSGRIEEPLHGMIDAAKPKDPRTRVDFWYKTMRRSNTVEYYDEKDGYVNRAARYEAEPVYIQKKPSYSRNSARITVIEADIDSFERRRPVPYRRYR